MNSYVVQGSSLSNGLKLLNARIELQMKIDTQSQRKFETFLKLSLFFNKIEMR